MKWLPKAARRDGFPYQVSSTTNCAIYGPTAQKLKRQFKNIVHLINTNGILLNLVTTVCLCASRHKNFLLKFND